VCAFCYGWCLSMLGLSSGSVKCLLYTNLSKSLGVMSDNSSEPAYKVYNFKYLIVLIIYFSIQTICVCIPECLLCMYIK